MPQTTDDPMRYIPTREENEAAFAAEPLCHNLSHRTAVREVEMLEEMIEQ